VVSSLTYGSRRPGRRPHIATGNRRRLRRSRPRWLCRRPKACRMVDARRQDLDEIGHGGPGRTFRLQVHVRADRCNARSRMYRATLGGSGRRFGGRRLPKAHYQG
jgi:hypothetical protein